MAPFSHLHVHSCFSFHDGTDTPAALVEQAASLGFGSLALTDTNGLYGAVAFCTAAKAAGIAPVLGTEIDFGSANSARAAARARPTAAVRDALRRAGLRRRRILSGELPRDARRVAHRSIS